jgi:hypothetical protein
MDQKSEVKKERKPKGFFGRFFEKLDKKLEEKAKQSKCCCCGGNDKDKSCSK